MPCPSIEEDLNEPFWILMIHCSVLRKIQVLFSTNITISREKKFIWKVSVRWRSVCTLKDKAESPWGNVLEPFCCHTTERRTLCRRENDQYRNSSCILLCMSLKTFFILILYEWRSGYDARSSSIQESFQHSCTSTRSLDQEVQ